mmetsp:Transcript_70836/g.153849  ORF Transcript_70836/g.153849 Transcript_70836/m.153849 type:complete len:194 (+) Transcript_70836:60-641(+)
MDAGEEEGVALLDEAATAEVEEQEAEAAAAAAAANAPPGGVQGRTLEAEACWPQDLIFMVPEDHRPGDLICVHGPHGPLRVQCPEGAAPGRQATVRLGPEASFAIPVTVPDDAKPGDKIQLKGRNGEDSLAEVPPGMKPGDQFNVFPPTVMVQVPTVAQTGDQLVFDLPDARGRLSASVPPGALPGSYFAAMY